MIDADRKAANDNGPEIAFFVILIVGLIVAVFTQWNPIDRGIAHEHVVHGQSVYTVTSH